MRNVFVTAVCALFMAPGVAWGDELTERAAIQRRVSQLYLQGKFQELEKIGDDYLQTKARTGSGLWKTTVYHGTFALIFNVDRKEEEYWSRLEQPARKWVEAHPQSAPARLAYAQWLMNRGWSFRGSGYAHTVRPEDWKPFREYTQKARSYLEEHKAVASKNPNWYVLMAIVGNRQSWPEERFAALVEEGLNREPFFYQLYFSALDYYTPKWGGSAAAVEQFAQDAVKRTRSVEGYGMYARIYWYASQSQYNVRLFTESQANWASMKRGIDDVLKKYPDNWNIQNFALFACLAEDKAKTAELFARIEGHPIMEAWGETSNFNQCKAWATAEGPPIPPR
jgi:hypothetical protein